MINPKRFGILGVLLAPLLALTLDLQVSPSHQAAPASETTAITLSVGAPAAAFDAVGYVWNKFRKGVLGKVKDFIRGPIDAAKRGVKRLIDTAVSKLKTLFTNKVMMPALVFALGKLFPRVEKVLAYVRQVVGKVDHWVNVADKYAAAVDAFIMGQAQKFKQHVGEASNALDVIARVDANMIVNILITIAKEKASAFIKAQAVSLLNKAYQLLEKPIQMGKAAACSAIGSIPLVGGVLRGAADLIITQGLALLRDKGFDFVANEAVTLGNRALDAIGKQLLGVAVRVDRTIAPVLDKVKGFISRVAAFIAPLRKAFTKVKAGLNAATKTVGTLRASAQASVAQNTPATTPTATTTPVTTPITKTPAPTTPTPTPVTAGPSPSGNTEVTNLALRRPARQSSTGWGGAAARAVDGNTTGVYGKRSVTHTQNTPQAWWGVDLGALHQIDKIKIFNRTDCCKERLANFFVLISDRPFGHAPLGHAVRIAKWKKRQPHPVGAVVEFPVNTTGRFVRVQLAGRNFLSLAEVQVIGH